MFDARTADYSITSPFNSVVLEKLLDAGAMVTNLGGILTLSNKEALIIEGKVDELDAKTVKVGQKVLISFDSLKEKVFEGTVRTLAPRIDYATKSYKIKMPSLQMRQCAPACRQNLTFLCWKNLARC